MSSVPSTVRAVRAALPVLAAAVLLPVPATAPLAGQTAADSVAFLPPEVHRADGTTLLPHRLELEETTRYENDSTDVDSYTYLSVEEAQGWDERQLLVDWIALTWNGTGHDRNLVAQDGLALRGRITPSGIPFAQHVESHYYPGVSNHVQVNPDADLQRDATLDDRPTGVHNEIVVPYVLSRLELWEGRRFILPDYSPYRSSAPLGFRVFVVREPMTVEDDMGHTHRGWRVDSVWRPTVEEARAAADDVPARHVRYYVSADAPYMLGKEWVDWTDGRGRTVRKRWRLTVHETIGVTPGTRMEEILRVRNRRAAGQVIPWRTPGGGD